MSESSMTTATAARLEAAARSLSSQAQELTAFSKRCGESMRAAIEELPRHAEAARAAASTFLAGIRDASRDRR